MESEEVETPKDAQTPEETTAGPALEAASGKKVKSKDLLIILAAGVLAGLSYLLTAPMSLAPGVQYRLFAFVAPTLGIILGKYRGGVAAAIAEAVWAYVSFYILGIPVLSIATPFALVGNFFQAYIPGLMAERLGEGGGRTLCAKNAGVIIGGAILGLGVLTFFWFGVFFEVLGVAPYMVIVEMLIYSDFPPMIIGTVPFTWLVLRLPGIDKGVFSSRW